ncbi:MAG: glutamate synthase-related protein [Anaerolineales bacterium]|jgi:hypothetical protein
MTSEPSAPNYQRYHIDTQNTPDIIPWPNRFQVKVSKVGLAKLLIQEIIKQRGDMKAVTSRPCLYGTFSGPVGGFSPRPEYCVGCLRCTTQHPDMVQILPNPERQKLGDSYFHYKHINAVIYEAETGSIPVKGAGYRGKFGGQGWDGIWTDMSEIVRPTRDGIHGREFISTVVDIGCKPSYLVFDQAGKPVGITPDTFSIPLPIIFDIPAISEDTPLVCEILSKAGSQTQTLSILPISQIIRNNLSGNSIVPLIDPSQFSQLSQLAFTPKIIEIDASQSSINELKSLVNKFPTTNSHSQFALRLSFDKPDSLLAYFNLGFRIFHLVSDLHGRHSDGRFMIDLIREAHLTFVGAGRRDEVTLIGSGGVVAAEHVPKAILCGLDLVALDTPLLAAMQAEFTGECFTRGTNQIHLPRELSVQWGVQRIKNMTAAWRDQLLEILGAMGLREVRRLRGEIGRVMFQADLEREAFAEIEGYLE